ncbi:hypothetical protein [Kineococcus indalonis]|uniref:hypothetical protein n=1 Tax=Kineococcus indalonis TaxID=2696566 RepID=UPI001413228A|nr:hypothetical protein [Kineococcus indalonis]NAZ85853.1 hypothetical protein [Kineococcus indalonis]
MDTPLTNTTRRVPVLDVAGDPRSVDLRDPGPLDALREAYAERLALIAAHAPDDELARNAQLVRILESGARPVRSRLRRDVLDPATFLG